MSSYYRIGGFTPPYVGELTPEEKQRRDEFMDIRHRFEAPLLDSSRKRSSSAPMRPLNASYAKARGMFENLSRESRPPAPVEPKASPPTKPASPPALKKPASPPTKPATPPSPTVKRPASPPTKPASPPALKKPASPPTKPASPPALKKPASPPTKPATPPSPTVKRPASPPTKPASPPALKKPASPPTKPATPPSPTVKRPASPPTKSEPPPLPPEPSFADKRAKYERSRTPPTPSTPPTHAAPVKLEGVESDKSFQEKRKIFANPARAKPEPAGRRRSPSDPNPEFAAKCLMFLTTSRRNMMRQDQRIRTPPYASPVLDNLETTFPVLFENNPQLKAEKVKWEKTYSDENLRDFSAAMGANKTPITTLDMSRNGINDASLKFIAKALKTNTTLTELNLSFNKFGSPGTIDLFLALKQNSTLKKLVLAGNRIGEETGKSISSALMNNSTLTVLDFDHCDLRKGGTQRLSEGLSANKSLRELNLNANDIEDFGIMWISDSLCNNTTLTKLSVDTNNFGGLAAMQELHDALVAHKSLRELSLQNNVVTQEGGILLYHAIKANTSIMLVDVRENPNITLMSMQFDELCQSRPGLKILTA